MLLLLGILFPLLGIGLTIGGVIVAVWQGGNVIPPCGRCREFIRQMHPDNLDTEVIIARDKIVQLRELLPYHDWLE